MLHHLLETTGFSIVKRTLDPYYVATGLSRVKPDLYYYSCLMFQQVFQVNVYDAMLVIARKSNPERNHPVAGGS